MSKSKSNVVLASLLCLVAACAADSEGVAEEVDVTVQEVCVPRPGAGYTLQRPLSWNRNGVTCVEGPDTPIFLADGDPYTAIAVPSLIFGSGTKTVKNNGGCLQTVSESCSRAGSQQ